MIQGSSMRMTANRRHLNTGLLTDIIANHEHCFLKAIDATRPQQLQKITNAPATSLKHWSINCGASDRKG